MKINIYSNIVCNGLLHVVKVVTGNGITINRLTAFFSEALDSFHEAWKCCKASLLTE